MRSVNKVMIIGFLLVVAMYLVPVTINAQSPVNKIIPGTIESLLQNQKAAPNSTSAVAVNGLQQIYSETGKFTLSADGKGFLGGASTIRVIKPYAQATVRMAILISTVTNGTISNGCVTIGGFPVTWNGNASSATSTGISFRNYWSDVTSNLRNQLDGFPKDTSTLTITECNSGVIDGEALLVVFNDTSAVEKTIVVMFGAINPTGDNFSITLAKPIDPKKSGALLDMGLGIGFGFQQSGGVQTSQVSVNNRRLTSSAGGEDDGASANGALITIGGIGDVNTNPANPLAGPTNPRSDDELYNILPFIDSLTTSLNVNTINPSNDDNIFLAYFAISGAAIVGEGILLSQTDSSGNVGTSHTVKAAVIDSLGRTVPNRSVTFTIISGPNSGGTFSTNTNSNGEAFYTYTGRDSAGTDSIQASFINSRNQVTSSNKLTFQWIRSRVYYSKPSGDLHNVLTWGLNMDGSGANPPDFGAGKTFILSNRMVNYTMTANWTVGGILSRPAGSQLQINGFTLSVADLTGTGTLSGTTTSNLIVNQPSSGGTSLNFTAGANNLNNLGIAAPVTFITLTSALNVYGVLTVQSGALNTTNLLTLKSTAVNTARVAPVTGIILGSVTVERYIPARRAWRILSAPVSATQSINSAWQEGATTSSANPNPNPGYGTHITEGSPANGFDHNPLTAMVSIKRYVSATDTWNPLANTNTTAVNSGAFLLFVRGERGFPLGFNTVPATITTLRATGPLKTGDQTFQVSASGFTAVPNPFASPIDFSTITRNNVQNNFYLWDPKMGGEFGVGGYVLLSFNGSGYDVIPASVSPESQYIQSGQGFLVRSTGTAGSLIIKESDKSATDATDVFSAGGSRTSRNGTPFNVPVSTNTAGLRVSLKTIHADNTSAVLDEVLSAYGSTFSDNVDNLDAQKVANVEENLAILRGSQKLMADRSAALDEKDVIQLNIWNTAASKRYLLEFNPANLSAGISTAYLVDKYLKTSTRVPLSKMSQLYFTVNSDAASTSSDRFSVVFKAPSDMAAGNSRNGIITYPNPVNGRTIQLMFNDQPQGTYGVELVNGLGQVVHRAQLQHSGGSAIRKIELGNKPATGVYMLKVSNKAMKNTLKIIVE